MKALIFAAGIGSRLKPWTLHHPKALVDVGGKPMLQRVIENIIEAGINDIIINVHHFAEQIFSFVETHEFDADISISDESDLLLETGGGLLKVLDSLNNEPVLIHNADVMTNVPLKELIDLYNAGNSDALLLTQARTTSRYFVFDRQNRLKGWTNISTGEVKPASAKISSDDQLLAFDGIHIVNPSAYPSLKAFRQPDIPFSITDFYIAECQRLTIKAFPLPEKFVWFDVGKPETLEKARLFFCH